MIYALNELRLAALAPWNAVAKTSLDMLTSPFSPFAWMPESRRLAAGAEVFYRLTQRYEKPAFGIGETLLDGARIGVEERVALEKPFCRLLRFAKTGARAAQPKLLLVAPLSGHHSTLLRDTVRALLPGHDVYVTDWTDARMVPLAHGPFHLDDYVDYIREFIRFLGPDMHVVSVCQPTVPVLAAVALMADAGESIAPRTMVMMGGPIDARRSPTKVNDLATRRPMSWFERSVIDTVPAKYPGFMRRVYPGFLQHVGFVAMNPRRHVLAHWDFYNHLVKGDGDSAEAHRSFYDEYNAVLDMPAEYYLDTIRTVFKEHRLARGTWRVRGDRVRPGAIQRTALLTIEGELDDISGNGQTEAAQGLCTGIPARKREHLLVNKVGHYGIFSGRRWRESISQRIGEFIRRHS
jgi:poly(3-hydroxybutyrate) depolymerase